MDLVRSALHNLFRTAQNQYTTYWMTVVITVNLLEEMVVLMHIQLLKEIQEGEMVV